MGTETAGRSRRLLTFRLDGELRQRLKARLAGEGRTMSEIVILGLQLYVRRSTWLSGPASPGPDSDAGTPPAGPAAAAVGCVADLVLPDPVAGYLRNLRMSGQSDLLSAALATLHDTGWPLRPLAAALGISRQAVQARIRRPVPAALRSAVPDMPVPSAYPRRRPALASGRRPHLTVKIDQALRSAAQRKAVREGSSLSQVIEKILHSYLRHGMPPAQPGDPAPARRRVRRRS